MTSESAVEVREQYAAASSGWRGWQKVSKHLDKHDTDP
jgi:hypothetical protein